MTYREYPAPPGLTSVVECVWTRSAPPSDLGDAESHAGNAADHGVHMVLPDGAMDVIATVHADGSLDDVFVVGAMTRPIEAHLVNQSLVGIRFLPGVGGSALATNATGLTDTQCALGDLLPPSSGAFDALRILIAKPDDAGAFREFAVRLGMQKRSVPSLVRAATYQLAQAPTRVRVENVARELGVSRQHLARTFAAHSGLTPKQFATICRVRALLAEVRETKAKRALASRSASLREPKSLQWSDVAARYGYADQSHLIADVRAVTGITPVGWDQLAGSIFPIAPVPVGSL
jgi:AraC-like DNA-binding protein